MRINSFTDLGLRALMYLACLPEGKLSNVCDIAKVHKASQNNMVKIVGRLRGCGYIKTVRGRSGGVYLALSAEQINIGDVIRNLEKYTDGVGCETFSCELLNCCQLKKAFKVAMEAFFTAMGKYTLKDLISNTEQLNSIWVLAPLENNNQHLA